MIKPLKYDNTLDIVKQLAFSDEKSAMFPDFHIFQKKKKCINAVAERSFSTIESYALKETDTVMIS